MDESGHALSCLVTWAGISEPKWYDMWVQASQIDFVRAATWWARVLLPMLKSWNRTSVDPCFSFTSKSTGWLTYFPESFNIPQHIDARSRTQQWLLIPLIQFCQTTLASRFLRKISIQLMNPLFGGKLKQKDKASNLWYRRKTFPDIAEGQIYPGSTRHSVPGTSMCQEAPRWVQQYKKAEASRDVQLSGVDDLGQKSGETIQHWSMSVVSDWAKKTSHKSNRTGAIFKENLHRSHNPNNMQKYCGGGNPK